ncbi:Vitamin B12 transport ATP-binding protein BacA [compost metagenome]
MNLAHLADRLDLSQDWSRILSVGEQQRLAFARVLFNRPQIVFLDESTSAMDEGLEHSLYSLLREEMRDTMLVSVGHRATLATFHTHRLEMDGQGSWSLFEQQPVMAGGA